MAALALPPWPTVAKQMPLVMVGEPTARWLGVIDVPEDLAGGGVETG